MLWAHRFLIGKYNVLIKIQVMKALEERTIGVSSRLPHTAKHVICLDYDNITDDRLKEELAFLQEEFKIGNFYVLETRETGKHAVCLDALRFKDMKEVVDSSSCDLMFKKGASINEYRNWVLRFDKKGNRDPPKYLYTVESPFEGKNLQSLGHAKYLLNFGVRIELKNPYGSEDIEVQEYNTGTRTEAE